MNVIKHRLSLEMTALHSQATIHIKKDDTKNKLIISLSENGKPYEITENVNAVFVGKKPDGKIVFNACNVVGDRIEYTITAQTSVVVGMVACEIRLYDKSNNLLTSPRFTMVVDEIIYDPDKIEFESVHEFNVLDSLISEATAALKDYESRFEAKQDKWVELQSTDGITYELNTDKEYLVTIADSGAVLTIIAEGYTNDAYCGSGMCDIDLSTYDIGARVRVRVSTMYHDFDLKRAIVMCWVNDLLSSGEVFIETTESQVDVFKVVGAEIATSHATVSELFEDYIFNRVNVPPAQGGAVDMSNYFTKKETTAEVNKAIETALTEAKNSGEFDGPAGPQGPKGDKGDKGETGAIGPKGDKGDKGDTGETGPKGADGAKGDKGEKGEKGDTGEQGPAGANGASVTVSSVSESTEDGGNNVVTFSDGKTLSVKNGSKGSQGEQGIQGPIGPTGAQGPEGPEGPQGPQGDDYVLTEEDKAEIAAEVALVSVAKNQGSANVGKILAVGTDGNIILVDMPEGGASGDVIGTLDESNNILLTGNLADGTYTLKYENANGTYTEIGNLVVSTITNYAIYTNLENCLSSGATTIRGSGSATVTITPNKGYALPDSITVSGAGYSWNKANGQIVLSNPTSDVQISVIAVKSITNFIEPNTDNKTDWSIWCNDSRIGSDGTYRSSATQDTTNYIPVQNGDIIHINQGRIINSQIIGFYNSSKAKVTAGATTDLTNNGHIADATALSSTTLDAQFTITNASVAYIRFTLLRSSFSVGDDEIIVNIERNGEYL